VRTVTKYGEMWARNLNNINLIPGTHAPHGQGVYILYDGSMPVYVGKGNMRTLFCTRLQLISRNFNLFCTLRKNTRGVPKLFPNWDSIA